MKHVLTGFALLLTSTIFAQKLPVNSGQKFQVVTKTSSTTNIEVMGQSMENSSTSEFTTIYQVKSAADEGASIVSTISKIKMNASAMGQEMSYDSEKKDNEGPLADGMGGFVNKDKNVSLDAKGNVVKEDKLEGEDQLSMSGLALGKTSDFLSPALIGKEFKAGATWDDSTTTKSDKGSTTNVGTYTVKSVENGVATIEYAGTQKGTTTSEQMGQEITSTMANKVSSVIKADAKTGLITEKNSVIDVNVTAEASGMTIPVTGKITMNSVVTEVK